MIVILLLLEPIEDYSLFESVKAVTRLIQLYKHLLIKVHRIFEKNYQRNWSYSQLYVIFLPNFLRTTPSLRFV